MCAQRKVFILGSDGGISASDLLPADIPQLTTQASLAYAATVDLAFAVEASVKTLALTGDVTFTTSGKSATRELTVIIACDAAARTPTFPAAWKWLGDKPTSFNASKSGVLSMYCIGSTDADVAVAWKEFA
ncbi:MAG: hypothetical protein WC378_00890 [Opitutaceae bacterium]|jgi:hypothetical protein